MAWSLVAQGLTLAACSSTDTTPAAPAGPPIFQLSLVPAGGSVTSPDQAAGCIELGHDPRETITLVAEDPKNPGTITNWQFQPPFSCGDTVQCGYLLVTVDPGPHALVVASASVSADLPMVELQNPLGSHEILVELWNSNRTIALDGKGKPIRIRMTIVTAESCEPLPDGGLLADAGRDGAAPDASRDAGAPSTLDGALETGAAPDAAPRDSGARAEDATAPSADAAVLDAAPPRDATTLDAGRRD